MTLKDRITEDMKDAMRAKDAARLSTIRLLLAAIKQREVDERKELTDADVLAIIDKMVKQRRDSIAQFEAGKRHGPRRRRARPSSTCCRRYHAAAADATPKSTRRSPPRSPQTGAAGPGRHGQGDGAC